jgi:hypothetical protein
MNPESIFAPFSLLAFLPIILLFILLLLYLLGGGGERSKRIDLEARRWPRTWASSRESR